MDNGSSFRQDQEVAYEIQVQGGISQRWVDWFGNMTIVAEEDEPFKLTTAVVQMADQAALLGQLQKLHNLGFSLLQVRRIERVG